MYLVQNETGLSEFLLQEAQAARFLLSPPPSGKSFLVPSRTSPDMCVLQTLEKDVLLYFGGREAIFCDWCSWATHRGVFVMNPSVAQSEIGKTEFDTNGDASPLESNLFRTGGVSLRSSKALSPYPLASFTLSLISSTIRRKNRP